MPRQKLDNLSLDTAIKVIEASRKELQNLDNEKSRLIEECNSYRSELNELADKKRNIETLLKEKEIALMKKVNLKDEEASRKLKEIESLRAEVSALKGELQKKLEDAKEAEKAHRRSGDIANANIEKSAKTIKILQDIVATITERLKQI